MANIVKLFREVRQEAAKVTWPGRREIVQATVMVFVMVTLVALFFLATDAVLGQVMKWFLGLGR
jgi:preprotein translocase subunit SecE